MSLVSSRLSLTHRVTVQRNTSGEDAWGQQDAPGWEDHIPNLVCRGWEKTGREAVDATTVVVVDDARAIVPLGTDVTPADRLGDITYRGAVVIAGPIGIQAVLARADHLELVLRRLS